MCWVFRIQGRHGTTHGPTPFPQTRCRGDAGARDLFSALHAFHDMNDYSGLSAVPVAVERRSTTRTAVNEVIGSRAMSPLGRRACTIVPGQSWISHIDPLRKTKSAEKQSASQPLDLRPVHVGNKTPQRPSLEQLGLRQCLNVKWPLPPRFLRQGCSDWVCYTATTSPIVWLAREWLNWSIYRIVGAVLH